jgi:hypothetical protein
LLLVIVNPFTKGGTKMLSFPASTFSLSYLLPTEAQQPFFPPKGIAIRDAGRESNYENI